MRQTVALPFVVMTFLCWGMYGPLLHLGRSGMGNNSLLQFICVGLAYFAIAVLVPLFMLKKRGETGRWTVGGAMWSLGAGAVGAVGALGVIFALTNGGSPVYVMPIVFGLAPVVNTFVSMWMTRSFKDAGKIFLSGVVLVAVGAAGVMYFARARSVPMTSIWDLTVGELTIIISSIAVTALCWGAYGPVLHKGQMRMDGSRMRPFLCVGLAYFLIAVLVPIAVLAVRRTQLTWTIPGASWSFGAGAAGAIGALGIILAFNFGGRPIFVMPLVFGGAPVVNTVEFLVEHQAFDQLPVMFYVSLLSVIAGAVIVLVFAPRPRSAGHGR